MQIKLIQKQELNIKEHFVILFENLEELSQDYFSAEEKTFIQAEFEKEHKLIHINRYTQHILVLFPQKGKKRAYQNKENYRNIGHEVQQFAEKNNLEKLQITASNKESLQLILEGLVLSTYQFLKYKTEKKENKLTVVEVIQENLEESFLSELTNLAQANFIARDLVNEPFGFLTAQQFSVEADKYAEEADFSLQVLHKKEIEDLGMTAFLAVNQGSKEEPTFNIFEYKSENATNEKPIVLVGKGVVYDTGGLSIKTAGMEEMKCDMGGAATVLGTMYAIAKNKLPIHVIGLVAATDNHINNLAYAPGDVVTTMSGTTVEVLNTDAEGRMTLADALHYAKRFDPELVIDLATLTGSAVRLCGPHASPFVGNVGHSIMQDMTKASLEVYERLIELPLFEEYQQYLESDIADLNNLGVGEGQIMIAGKFLEHFTDYPWIHIDIAGPVFIKKPQSYRGKQATGFGVRLLYQFLKDRAL